ncbi:multicopper oxidase family protein [Desulfosarcina sp.]|uniref:multicopper oxidase family protein n=1 Tax=Desulfosarcina sp. TaxID=2027861 RepID=UPI003561A09D
MRKNKRKNKFQMNLSRRQVLKAGLFAGAGMMLPWRLRMPTAHAATQGPGLSDPSLQPKFMELVPNALDPGFIFDTLKGKKHKIKVAVSQTMQQTGLQDAMGNKLWTTVWGYGEKKLYTWPGRTFQVRSYEPLEVKWENKLKKIAPIITGKDNSSLFGNDPTYDFTGRSVIDTNLHWAYSLHGYERYSIEKDGVPIVPHVHGGHNDFEADGNPEFFFSPNWKIRGPQWLDKKYLYDNSQPAGTVWYHDHALGITRLNVYAGMAGFYIIRDDFDTGLPNNPLSLPAFPYEAAFAIQDKMFKDTGELFYPAFPGDPFYVDFITGEGATLPEALFPGGGPTGLAEFFGDHMVVNGKIWPKMDVEPRNYRLRLLNGCDSRFLAIQFRKAASSDATNLTGAGDPIPFTVIGSDQGLASEPTTVTTLIVETGSRYDIIFDFNDFDDERIIMENIGGDEPFGGGLIINQGGRDFPEMDRVMAFDVVLSRDNAVPDVSPVTGYATPIVAGVASRTRKVALFEGTDEYGRLQPLLGTAEPATDHLGNSINWPATTEYELAVFPDGTPSPLVGQMEGSIAWHSPTTENPALNSTEEWEVWNVTGDAHPVHLHLVHFEVLGREAIKWDTNADEDGFIPDGSTPAEDGTYLVPQPTVQHNSVAGDPATYGQGFRIVNPQTDGPAIIPPEQKPDAYVENAPKDVVTALPGQVTRIKATFDKPGRYVWHCHILSHEDHEMMRVMHVGPGA